MRPLPRRPAKDAFFMRISRVERFATRVRKVYVLSMLMHHETRN